MDDLAQALEGLPGFVGQLDLHQHSYDTNVAERLVIRGEEYLELLQVLYMRCEQVMDSQQTSEDLWMLFGMVQRKVTPYVDLLGSNPRDDIQWFTCFKRLHCSAYSEERPWKAENVRF